MQILRDFLKDRLNIFFSLALLPLIVGEFYGVLFLGNTLGIIIPFYGFLILLMKKDKLAEYIAETSHIQKALGTTMIIGSVFAYYAIAPFFQQADFYGLANYTLHLIGLFLIFFRASAFKQGFTSFFLIAASGLTGLAFRWIEVQMSFTVPYYVSLFSFLLTTFNINHTLSGSATIYLYSQRGLLPLTFEAGCIGIYSVIIFSIIMVVTMIETSASRRTKLLWSLAGLIGIFILNIIRLFIVIVTMNLYGWDFGQSVHQVIGYVLFLSWLGIFLLLFSERRNILGKIRLIRGQWLQSAGKRANAHAHAA